ncbi:alpha-amylase family protein [Acidihalobacter yilgarnensis]|uniref:alpha-amylase family protein n=1 Tax=Acidihalobacter yilgarnensis TaxID=2819280 RepID=UPI0012EA41F0|nr:alpha-amylase family protein [Acidihalobacter yilgarnensis]
MTLATPALAHDETHGLVWPGYQIIMWQTKTARQYQVLRSLGVTAARVQADRHGETRASAARKVEPIVQAGLRPYVENIATDFYSAYHRWTPGKPKNWRFLALQARIAQDPQDKSVFVRQPSLSDRHALGRIETRLTRIVRDYAFCRPLFFNLGDETGIADLTAAWDFDYSKPSLDAFRVWLRRQYGTLAALNREWGTHYRFWRAIVPPTTTATMARTDGNYAAWSDFKAFMDVAFVRAIRAGTDAIHRGAPWAQSAIEGAQMPGWGGYNYALLAPAVDVMELYDAGQNLALAQSFHPGIITLTTTHWSNPGALHQAWREFLRGTRGMILWDPDDRFVHPDGAIGTQAKRAEPFFRQMHTGIGPLIEASKRAMAPIAVLYSPESFRIQWMLDHRNLKAAWTKRGSAIENEDDAVRRARREVYRMLARLGLTPHFVSEPQIATGILHKAHDQMLVLPQTLALSLKSASAIKAFVKKGGVLLTVGQTGLFDGHGRRLSKPELSHLLASANPRVVSLPIADTQLMPTLLNLLKTAGISWQARVENATGQVEEYIYRLPPVKLLALLSDSTSKQHGGAHPVTIVLPKVTYVYDIRAQKLIGKTDRFTVDVSSTEPTVLALSKAPLSRRSCTSVFQWRSCP